MRNYRVKSANEIWCSPAPRCGTGLYSLQQTLQENAQYASGRILNYFGRDGGAVGIALALGGCVEGVLGGIAAAKMIERVANQQNTSSKRPALYAGIAAFALFLAVVIPLALIAIPNPAISGPLIISFVIGAFCGLILPLYKSEYLECPKCQKSLPPTSDASLGLDMEGLALIRELLRAPQPDPGEMKPILRDHSKELWGTFSCRSCPRCKGGLIELTVSVPVRWGDPVECTTFEWKTESRWVDKNVIEPIDRSLIEIRSGIYETTN